MTFGNEPALNVEIDPIPKREWEELHSPFSYGNVKEEMENRRNYR